MLDKGEVILSPETKERSILYRPVYATGNRLMASLKDFIAEHGRQARDLIGTKNDPQ